MPMRTVWSSFIALLILTTPAAARMYQWESPASGRVQLSGAAPPWYRAAVQGPRVLVFENGQLIDDTAHAVTEPRRVALREAALGAATATTTAPEGVRDADVRLAAPPAPPVTRLPDDAPAIPASKPVREAAKAAELKALIDAWDAQQLEAARSLLDLVPATEAAPPAAPAAP